MIDIPSTFNYQKVEILILPIETETKTEVFEPENFFGVSHIENVEQAIHEIRDEWD